MPAYLYKKIPCNTFFTEYSNNPNDSICNRIHETLLTIAIKPIHIIFQSKYGINNVLILDFHFSKNFLIEKGSSILKSLKNKNPDITKNILTETCGKYFIKISIIYFINNPIFPQSDKSKYLYPDECINTTKIQHM